jgi:hypothetical protein
LPINIFLSVGRALSPEQEQFVAATESFLIAHDLTPRTVGRSDFAHQKPLKRVAEVLRECSGTIIVALERLHIAEGLEFRGAAQAVALTNVSLPTVWNQVEAAMAYTLGQPLLAIVETGLRNEGVLEEGYDWYVKWLNLNPDSLQEPEFLKTFDEWKSKVEKYQRGRE